MQKLKHRLYTYNALLLRKVSLKKAGKIKKSARNTRYQNKGTP
jgi:hypothetical protein